MNLPSTSGGQLQTVYDSSNLLKKKNILLTGSPGIGKTTIIKKIVSKLSPADGFLTEEIRENNIRKGFKIVTLDGKEGILASCNVKTDYRVGKYYPIFCVLVQPRETILINGSRKL